MEETMTIAGTSTEESIIADSGEQEVAVPESEETSALAFTDGETGEKNGEAAVPPPEEKHEMSKAERAEQARLRRERERAEAEQRAYERGRVEAFKGMKNPFTGEEIQDALDVNEYQTMLEIERSGGDPIADFAKYAKDTERKKLTEKDEQEIRRREAEVFVQKDTLAFGEANPDVDVPKLLADKRFARFAGSRVGKESLQQIYDDFIEFMGEVEAKAETKAEKLFAKAVASPGSLSGGETRPVSYETMSDADFERKLNAVLSGKEHI